MTKKCTMSMYASKEDLEADKIKAAAFDWISENIPRAMFTGEPGGNIVIAECDPFISLIGEGKDLLEAVQNAMDNEALREMAARVKVKVIKYIEYKSLGCIDAEVDGILIAEFWLNGAEWFLHLNEGSEKLYASEMNDKLIKLNKQ